MNNLIVFRMKPHDGFVYLKSGEVVHVPAVHMNSNVEEFFQRGQILTIMWQNGEKTVIQKEAIEMIHVGNAPIGCTCELQGR